MNVALRILEDAYEASDADQQSYEVWEALRDLTPWVADPWPVRSFWRHAVFWRHAGPGGAQGRSQMLFAAINAIRRDLPRWMVPEVEPRWAFENASRRGPHTQLYCAQ